MTVDNSTLPTSSPTGGAVYWIGADNNIYLKGAAGTTGVVNLGQAPATMGIDNSANNGYGITPSQINLPGANYQATQIADPGAVSQLPGVNAGTVIPGVNDPATIAGYGQAIDQANQTINQIPTQLQGSEDQIQAAYNTAYQTLLGNANQAAQSYGSNTTQNQQGYVTNKNTIGQNAGQSLNGIERLLGSRGAGGSSAAIISAPQAVASEATQQRAGAGQTYGANQNALDTSYGNYKTQNANNISSLQSQTSQQTNAAEASANSTRAGLLQEIATLSAEQAAAQGSDPTAAAAPYLAQAQQYLTAANQLGLNVFTPTIDTTAYSAPSATSYTTNQFATPTAANPNAGIVNNSVNSAYSPLLKATSSLSGVPNTAATPAAPVAGS